MNTRRWATSEELLLVCAVDRHGAEDWDSIAVEVQSRCFEHSFPLSSQDCRSKFNDLKRRFMFHDHPHDSASLMHMVDELKRIRVEELRREVQSRDGLIMLLELKVKRLEGERERSVKEETETDPIDNRDGRGGERKLSMSISSGTSVPGEDTDDRVKRSFHESSSSKKCEVEQNGVSNDQARLEPVEPMRNEAGPVRTDSEAERKWPFIGDSNIEEKEHGASESRTDGLGDSNESLESDGKSEREENEEEVEKDSKNPGSGVQSSASLSRRKGRRRRGEAAAATPRDYRSGEEREGDEVSPAIKRASVVESGPFINLLEIISSHQLGSRIERRLQSQESKRYKSLIRQHMDLHIVKSRLDKGIYSNSNCQFFRDLLLLYNNVIVFFRSRSKEFEAAALELRALVMKEMIDSLKTHGHIAGKLEPKQESPHDLPRCSKSPTLVSCFKQGSSQVPSDNGSGKGDVKRRDIVEKMDGSFVEVSEKGARRKRSKGSFMISKGGFIKSEHGGNALSSNDRLETKNVKKDLTAKQKEGAARFLKSMKRQFPGEDSENELVKGLAEEKTVNGKGEGKRGRGRKRSEVGREVNGEVKRGKGRPPKQPEHRVAEIQKGKREAAPAGAAAPGVARIGGSRSRKRLRRQ